MDSSNISSTISNAINYMFNNIFSSIDNTLYSVLDDFTFINCDILYDDYFFDIFGYNFKEGILLVANALIFGYLLYYSFKLLLSHLCIIEVERPFQFIFKLIICAVCMNASIFICEEIIYLASLFSSIIRELGVGIYETEICFSSLITKLNPVLNINGNSLDIFSIDGIIKSLISIGLLNLVIAYSIRFVLVKIFVLISPFCFLSLCNKSSSILFKVWLKSFISLLLVQVFVSLILLLVFGLNIKSNNLMAKFTLFAAISILIKANNYVRELLGGISTEAGISISNLKSSLLK